MLSLCSFRKMDFYKIPIEDDFNECEKYSSVVQRYYSPRYCIDVSQPFDDYCVLIHSNRVCLVTLAPSHFIFKTNELVSVSYKVSDGVNRLKNKVSGKAKHGAQRLQPKSPLAVVSTSQETYTLISPISGKLLEVNQKLIENPGLLLSDPQGKGYVAIVLPEIRLTDEYRTTLLNHEQYSTTRELE